MKTAKVTIEGIAPLLMNKFSVVDTGEEKARKKGEIYSHDEECEQALYRNKDGCYVPSTWISAMLKKAGTQFKKGKSSYKNIMDASVFVEPDEIPLGKKTYDEKLIVPVVIQRQRIVKARPKFNNWKITFNISFNDNLIKKDILKQILADGGETIGIGDWRPKYGRFKVTEFKVR